MKLLHPFSALIIFAMIGLLSSGCSTNSSKASNASPVQANGLKASKMYCTSAESLDQDNDAKESAIRKMLKGTKAQVFRVKGSMCLDVIVVYVQKNDMLKGSTGLADTGKQVLNKLSFALHTHEGLSKSRISVHAYTNAGGRYDKNIKKSSVWAESVASNFEVSLKTRSSIPHRGFGEQHLIVPKAIVGDGIGDRNMNNRIEILVTSEHFTGPLNLSVSKLVGYNKNNIKQRNY